MRLPFERPILLGIVLAALAWSAIGPQSWGAWCAEVFWVFAGIPLLILTHRRFPLTPLAERLLTLHAVVLIVGGHYTYSLVPVGNWVRDALGLSRNPYDRLGHLFQGFVPAVLAREILLRRSPLAPGKWLFFLTTCVCLAFSAFFEFLEWGAAVFTGAGREGALAEQGDPWDTQWDMLCCLIGALASQLLLSRRHDRELATLLADHRVAGAGPE
jgi:putative membrane protein